MGSRVVDGIPVVLTDEHARIVTWMARRLLTDHAVAMAPAKRRQLEELADVLDEAVDVRLAARSGNRSGRAETEIGPGGSCWCSHDDPPVPLRDATSAHVADAADHGAFGYSPASVTVSEAAALAGCSPRRIRQLLEPGGPLDGSQPGGPGTRRYVSVDSLDAWLDCRRSAA